MRFPQRSLFVCALVLLGCGSDGGGTRPGTAATTKQIADYCSTHCNNEVLCTDGAVEQSRCVSDCRDSYAPATVRTDYIERISACEQKLTCRDIEDEDGLDRCQEQTLDALPATSAGTRFCDQNAVTLTKCELFDEDLSCLDWTKQIADATLPNVAKCTEDESRCSRIIDCIHDLLYPEGASSDDSTGGGGGDGGDGSDGTGSDGVYIPDDSDSCFLSLDGRCDESQGTGMCADGTDTSDCAGYTPGECGYLEDGQCDEPEGTGYCDEGTDVVDCAPVSDSCASANNGTCEEPLGCLLNTDSTDCSKPNSCITANNGTCEEGNAGCKDGTDTADCSGPDSCKYANDGVCDEPSACKVGTDTTDCSQATDPCVDDPQSDPSCPGYDVCLDNPQADPSCPGYDPCVDEPSSC